MTRTTEAASHPLIERLQSIAAIELAKEHAAHQSAAEAEQSLTAAQAAVLTAQRAVTASYEARTRASERVAAVQSTLDAALDFVQQAARPATATNDPAASAPRSRDCAAQTIADIILNVLAGGNATDLDQFNAAVQQQRPGTPRSSVRNAVADLRMRGLIESTDHGRYRSAQNTEAHRPA